MHMLQNLPADTQLLDLAYSTRFPASGSNLVKIATRKHYTPETVQFLRQFDGGDQFENGVDFVNRCEEVRLLEHELADAPLEHLLSQQD